MRLLALFLASLAPCQDRPGSERALFPSSRDLPADRTLIAVELAAPQTLIAHADRIFQIGAFRAEKMQQLLRWLEKNENDFKPLFARRGALRELIMSLDRGLTFATLFPVQKQGQPESWLIGATAGAKRFRGVEQRLLDVVAAPETEGYERKTIALADSPVSAHIVRKLSNEQFRGSVRYSLLTAKKARTLALRAGRHWQSGEDERSGDADRLETLARLLGLGDVKRGGWRVGHVPQLGEGEELLGRLVFRFHQNASDPDRTREREQKEMREIGVWGWQGVQSLLIKSGAGIRERVEVLHAKTEEPSLFAVFRDGERGLGDVAAFLPRNTVAVLRVSFDPKLVVERIEAVGRVSRSENEAREAIKFLRSACGLPPAEEGARVTLEGVDALTVAVVPQAAGSVLPEIVLLSRVPPRPEQAKLALTALGHLTGVPGFTGPESIRSLGKGDDAIRYIKLRGNNMGDDLGMKVMGGGFISATRVGPYFALGLNPRTVRKLARAVKKGETLATRDGFTERFPKGRGRALQGFFDFKAVAAQGGSIPSLLMLFVGVPMGGTFKMPPVPAPSDFTPWLGDEFLESEKTDFGHVVHLEGGTMLSPVAWGATIYASKLIGNLTSLAAK